MDKSHKFFQEASDVLTYNFQMKRDRTIIKTPFFHFTKTKVITWALEN